MLHKSGTTNYLRLSASLLTRLSVAVALLAAFPGDIAAKKKKNAPQVEATPEITAMDGVILETPAYRWVGDTIFQGPFKAYAPDDTTIISDYSAAPGYFMPIDKEWHLKNDISSYPRLSSSNTLHNAIFNMGLDEMVNAVEPDSTLRTGKEWPGVWTRDVSYSIILSMAMLQPEVSRISHHNTGHRLGRRMARQLRPSDLGNRRLRGIQGHRRPKLAPPRLPHHEEIPRG